MAPQERGPVVTRAVSARWLRRHVGTPALLSLIAAIASAAPPSVRIVDVGDRGVVFAEVAPVVRAEITTECPFRGELEVFLRQRGGRDQELFGIPVTALPKEAPHA